MNKPNVLEPVLGQSKDGKHVVKRYGQKLCRCSCSWSIWSYQVPILDWLKSQFKTVVEKHLKGK